ncbi:HAD family hydrolase [Nitriliruptor alkaliphilus]|uniref:HAD family hydrolase n=1 Tax=Nitriliruptor alkaliphilus TaxID=427918 RepID=UPI00069660FD|nr:HAD family hydrolase [Nitriliruptor alkaliphilus]
MSTATATLLDLDGTLVDSVYHHVVAWQDALREAGYNVAAARIHAGIGMGSDRLLPWLLGRHVDDADELSAAHEERFLARGEDLRPTRGARELLADLRAREVPFVIATSAGEAEREILLGVLGEDGDLPLAGAGEGIDSKPAPDILLAACAELAITPEQAMLVGDAPWDAVAAERAGIRAIGVRCGGFGDAILREAGCRRIVDDPAELIGQL